MVSLSQLHYMSLSFEMTFSNRLRQCWASQPFTLCCLYLNVLWMPRRHYSRTATFTQVYTLWNLISRKKQPGRNTRHRQLQKLFGKCQSVWNSFWDWRSSIGWQERIVPCTWGCQPGVAVKYEDDRDAFTTACTELTKQLCPSRSVCPHWEVYSTLILLVSCWLIQHVLIS